MPLDTHTTRSNEAMAETKANLKITKEGQVYVVEFEDRKILDELAITQIGEQLSELVASEPGIRLLLNFKNVEHLSSAALGMLITLEKQVKEERGRLKLSNIRPQIFEVFKITRLNRLFEIHDTAEAALQAF